MKYQHWTVYADTYLAEWGEYERTGNYTGTRVLKYGPDQHWDSNNIRLVMRVGGSRHYQGRNFSVSVCLQYFSYSEILWSFKCTSLKNAVRKANFRLRKKIDELIRQALSAIYRKEAWDCCYTEDGKPLLSFYYGSHEITNGKHMEMGRYVMSYRDGSASLYEFRGTCISGSGISKQHNYPSWTKDSAA